MPSFSQLRVNLELNIQKFARAMNSARRMAQQFSTELADASRQGDAQRLVDSYTTLNDRLHKVGLGLKDIARISSGIMISQAFYGIARSVREATDALWSFNESLDYAHVTYSALFGSSELAGGFIDTLKDFSIDTIFEYTDIEGMARKLSAYGIEYQNLMYIIEGLTNIGTISGDTAALERLAVAIGQINAKGTLKAEELRQLANAYTPIYDILRDKLGLTEEELGRVGDLGIKSADAINAIIEYANETFGATADAATQTITGLNNRIVDSLKVMGADVMAPLSTFYKSVAKYVADQLETIRGIYETSGLGGVFEYLVPSEEWQNRIRNFIATLKNFVSTAAAFIMTIWPYVQQFLGGMMDALSIFIGVINTVVSGLTGAIQSIDGTTGFVTLLTKALVAAAGAWLLFKLQALGAAVLTGIRVLIVNVASAVIFLTKALMANPLLTLFVLLGAVLLGVSANANNANSAISNLINSLNSHSAGGAVADDILQTNDQLEQGKDMSDEYWESMKDGADGAGDSLEDMNNKAKKASKSLLAFDEVFRLNESEDASNGGFGDFDGMKDLTDMLGGLGAGIGSALQIPDLSDYANKFVTSLYDSLWESIKTIATGGATGALIGGLVGFAIGGFVTGSVTGALAGAKWGAKIGGIAGAAFAGFWTDTYKDLEASLIKIATGGSTGALAGGLVGMVIGAFATKTLDGALAAAANGARLGGMLGMGLGGFWSAATEEMSNAIEGLVVGSSIGMLLGGLAGLIIGAFSTKTLAGALKGAELGVKIGTGVGAVLGGIFGSLSEEFQAIIAKIAVGGSVSTLVGALVGLTIGAFATGTLAGAKAGAKIGAGIGGIIGAAMMPVFAEAENGIVGALESLFSLAQGGSTGALVGGIAGMIIGAIVGAFAGGAIIPMAKAGANIGMALGTLGGMLVTALKNAGILDAISEWFSNLWNSIAEFFTGLKEWFIDDGNWKGIAMLIVNPVAGGLKLLYDNNPKFKAWADDLVATVKDGLAKFWDGVVDFFTGLKEWFIDDGNWKGIAMLIVNPVAGAARLLYDNNPEFKKWVDDLWTTIKDGVNKIATDISTWATNTLDDIGTWVRDTDAAIRDWVTKADRAFSDWCVKVNNDFVTWSRDTKNNINKWAADTAKKFTDWYNETNKAVSDWIAGLDKGVKDWWNKIWDASTWKSGWSSVKQWFSDLFGDISGWFTNLGKSIGDWWDGLWDGKSANVNISTTGTGGAVKLGGHATGGIFNREHIARFAEGNRAEAVIPLENNSAMAPFVNAISDGILQGLLPALAGGGSNANQLPPMYVGTLIADERGLQQLFKKFEVYEAKELARKGLT